MTKAAGEAFWQVRDATRLKTGIEALAVGGVATELAALSALIRSGQ